MRTELVMPSKEAPKKGRQPIEVFRAPVVLNTGIDEYVGPLQTLESKGIHWYQEGDHVRTKVARICIEGNPGSGTSTLMKGLGEAFGLPQVRLYSAGERHEELTTQRGQKYDHSGFQKRPLSQDEIVDNEQLDILRSATPENPCIVESRLAIQHLRTVEWAEAAQGITPPDSVSIHLFGDEKVLIKRAYDSRQPAMDFDEFYLKTKGRNRTDNRRWFRLGLTEDTHTSQTLAAAPDDRVDVGLDTTESSKYETKRSFINLLIFLDLAEVTE